MLRRSASTVAIAALMLLPVAGVSMPSYGGTVANLATVRVASGLNRPIFVTHAPGDEARLFIVEQRGVIRILDLLTETVLGSSFLDIDSIVGGPVNNFDERGLLGMAFHPDYDNNGFFYVYYTNNSSDTTVARYSVTVDPNKADPSSAEIILTIDQPQSNHNGGWIGFSPNDGYLYVATGDGGNFCDTGGGHTAGSGNGQDITNNKLGKLLRIIPSTTPNVGGYTNPGTNPFVGITGDDEIWAYGLRNPWRTSFDRDTGAIYIGDVGQDAREEINFQPGTSLGGENYGWRCYEGNNCSNISGCSTSPCGCNPAGLVFPIQVYPHGTGFSITGGYNYRGCDIPSLNGTYFYADFVTSRVWSFLYDGSVNEFTERTGSFSPSSDGFFISSIASFGEDARGEIYIVDRASTSNSEIFRIIREDAQIADFDCDGIVGINDFLDMLANWGACPGTGPCPWDLDRDGTTGINDFLALLADWGPV